MNLSHWFRAFRLRTLFLSLSCIWGGILCVEFSGDVSLVISALTISTALFLQVLSNLANDYGDSVHGADHAGRSGPSRTVQDGSISKSAMKRALIICSLLSFVSGIALLWFAHPVIGTTAVVTLLSVGLLSIGAAIAYTNGKRPYGYMGLGDISVMIFFGFVAVMGTQYLQQAVVTEEAWLLSVAYGCLSVGVLNLNNMRDIDSDRIAHKKSIPVRLGPVYALYYHLAILFVAFICFSRVTLNLHLEVVADVLILVIIGINMFLAARVKKPIGFDPLLKILSISTFIITLIIQLSL